jgi:tRNA(Arg) A34 adenosine deaminase TadA
MRHTQPARIGCGFIGLARVHVEHETGRSLGVAVFDRYSNRLVALGVNLVVATNCAVAHAEIAAIMLAQRSIEHFDLGAKGQPPHELVTSAEPRATCLGAISWSGVRHVVCGAHHEDARTIGFDEGPTPLGWVGELECRGISSLEMCAAKKLPRYVVTMLKAV